MASSRRRKIVENVVAIVCILISLPVIVLAVYFALRTSANERLAAKARRSTEAPRPHLYGHFPCVSVSLTDPDPTPQLAQCDIPIPLSSSGPVDRFEADLRYGTFILRQTDIFVKDVLAIPLTRTYDSGNNGIFAFGSHANHPFDIAPFGSRNPYTYMAIALEDGDFLYFDRISKGTSFADAVFQHTESTTRFYKATTRWNGDSWTTELTDGSTMLFPEAYNAKSLAQGAATEMRDSNGNRLVLQRDQERNLLAVRGPHGGFIKLVYDSQSRIIRSESSHGEWAQYRYQDDGMLVDVVFSSGAARHYSYDGALMTLVRDEQGRVLLHNYYAGWQLSRQDFADGSSFYYHYTMAANGRYVLRVFVTQPGGTSEAIYPKDFVSEELQK